MNDAAPVHRGNDLNELIKFLGAKQAGKIMVASDGLLTSTEIINGKYMGKAMLEPLGIETGWLPIGTGYAGNGFGMVISPDLQTEVTVLFSLGDLNCGKIICFNFNDVDVAPVDGINQGDAFFIHKSGSFAKFLNDGSVEISAQGPMTVSSESQVTVNCPSVDLGQTGGEGVVTGECVCTFTGGPHPDISGMVKAAK